MKLSTTEGIMNNQQSLIDRDASNRLYANIVRAIDGTNLALKIIRANDRIRNIETANGSSELTQRLRAEVSRMETQLTEFREQAATSVSNDSFASVTILPRLMQV